MRARLLILGLLFLPVGAEALEKKTKPPPEKEKALVQPDQQEQEQEQETKVEWDEEKVLEYVMAYNPIIKTQRDITREYTPPSTLQQVLEHTSVYARAATGTSSVVSENGSTTVTTPVTAGIQINIPLASPKESRELAEKALQEMTKIDEVQSKVIQDMTQLRQYEANLAAAKNQINFFEHKLGRIEKRYRMGLETEETLWDHAQKLNAVASEAIKLRLLIDAQRRKLAQYAGDQWKVLLAYLQGKGKLPGG